MDHANDKNGGTEVLPSICFTDSAAVVEDAKKGDVFNCLQVFTIKSRQGDTDSSRGKPYATLTRELEAELQVYKGTYKGNKPVTRFPYDWATPLHIEKSDGMKALMFLPEYDLACNVELKNYQVSIAENGFIHAGDQSRPIKQKKVGDYLFVDKSVVSVTNCEDVSTGQNFAYKARMDYLKAQPE